MKKAFRLTIGIGLVLLGVLGALLPVIPGFVFLIPGLVILSDFFPPLKRALAWAKQKVTSNSGVTGGEPPGPQA